MWRALFDAEVDMAAFTAECGEVMALAFAQAAHEARRYMDGEVSSDEEPPTLPDEVQAPLAPTTTSPVREPPHAAATPPPAMLDLDPNGYPYGMCWGAAGCLTAPMPPRSVSRGWPVCRGHCHPVASLRTPLPRPLATRPKPLHAAPAVPQPTTRSLQARGGVDGHAGGGTGDAARQG